ncbi:MAG: PAS domain S-box protein [Spirochaetota bacterium]
MIILDLVHNVSLLLALAVGYDYVAARLDRRSVVYRLVSGLLFGGVAIVGMLTPLEFAPGVIYDGRSIVLGVAGYMGGSVAGLIAAVAAAAYRVCLGGAGTTAGLIIIAEATALGIAAHHLRRRFSVLEHPLGIYLFAAVVHVFMLAGQTVLPNAVFRDVLSALGPTVLLFYPLGMLLTTLVMLNNERQQQTRRSLEASEERYRSLFENTYAPMLIIDPADGRIVDANRVAADFYGWSRDELRTMRVWDINVLARDQVEAEIERARNSAQNYFEFQHRLKDGSVREVAVYSGSVSLREGNRLYSIIRDVTERKEVEKELFLVGYSMEHAAIGVFRIEEPTGRILYVNQYACDRLGFSREELLGMTVFQIDPHFNREAWIEHRRVVAETGSRTIETVHRRKDGHEFPVEVTVSVLSYGGREYSFSFAKDITERKRMEAEVQASLTQKEALLREVHHRVRNNLAVMSGLVQLQMHQLSREDASRRALSKTRDRISVMAMIHTLLYHDQNLSSINFASVLERIVRELQDEYAADKRVQVLFDVEDVQLGVGEALPLGLIVNEAVTNSLVHAFGSDGHGHLKLSLHRTGAGGCTLTISDDGGGIGSGFEIQDQETLGFRLMALLAAQISADIGVKDQGGTIVTVSFRP